MSLTTVIEAVKQSQQVQQEIRSHFLPVSEAQTLFFDDVDTAIQLTALVESLSHVDDAGLSDKAIDMRDELVALLTAYNDEIAACVKENQNYNYTVAQKLRVEEHNMNQIAATATEKALSQKVQINSTKFTAEHMTAFREIYLELGVTHFLVEELRDVIYFNPETSPFMRDLIAERFLVRFPNYVNPKGFMNIVSVDFISNLERIQKAEIK